MMKNLPISQYESILRAQLIPENRYQRKNMRHNNWSQLSSKLDGQKDSAYWHQYSDSKY